MAPHALRGVGPAAAAAAAAAARSKIKTKVDEAVAAAHYPKLRRHLHRVARSAAKHLEDIIIILFAQERCQRTGVVVVVVVVVQFVAQV